MLRKAALLAVTIVLCACPAALAAFPGRDGVLAVQPLTGGGIELVHANVALSGNSTTLTWSHDGQPRSLQLR
jgi:hypothetical protein